MTQEIDISKLHGDIKRFAQMAERDKAGSKGYGKLNTQYEINLFKEMVKKYGKEKELKKQLPDFKGITVPVKDTVKNNEKDLNKKILGLMKNNDKSSSEEIKKAVSEKKHIKTGSKKN